MITHKPLHIIEVTANGRHYWAYKVTREQVDNLQFAHDIDIGDEAAIYRNVSANLRGHRNDDNMRANLYVSLIRLLLDGGHINRDYVWNPDTTLFVSHIITGPASHLEAFTMDTEQFTTDNNGVVVNEDMAGVAIQQAFAFAEGLAEMVYGNGELCEDCSNEEAAKKGNLTIH